jgi:hypothetical protein
VETVAKNQIVANAAYSAPIRNWLKDTAGVRKDLASTKTRIRDTVASAQSQARVAIYPLLIFPLVLCLIVTVLSCANVRGWPISICTGLIVPLTVVIISFTAIPLMLSSANELACDKWDRITDFAGDVLASKGCVDQVAEANAQLLATGTQFLDYMCNDMQLGELCSSLGCGEFPYQWTTNPCIPSGRFDKEFGVPNVGTVNSLTYYGPIVACADSATCAQSEMANRFRDYSTLVSNDMSALMSVYSRTVHCQIISDVSYRLFPTMCWGELLSPTKDTLNQLAVVFSLLAAACTLTFPIWMNGAKRFTKASAHERNRVNAQLHLNLEDPFLNPVLDNDATPLMAGAAHTHYVDPYPTKPGAPSA